MVVTCDGSLNVTASPEHAEASSPRSYRESVWATLRRTLTICLFITIGLTWILPRQGSFLRFFSTTYAAVLWFPLGGHYVELVYLNHLRMRVQWFHRRRYVARVGWWFLAGLPVGMGCWRTWVGLGNHPDFDLPFWWGMPFFVLAELVVHTVLSAAGRPSFWNGRE